MKQQAAVLGVGQTRHRARRSDVSIAGLCREAVDRALADAGTAPADIDAIVVGKAPDLFEGVMMPELYLADALGAVGKPLLRVHTAGPPGGAEGACAVGIGGETAAEAAQAGGRPVAWIRATAMRTEPTMFSGKDHVNPRAGADAAAALWRQAGITSPLEQIDVAEIYVPFSWFEPMWLENLGFPAGGQRWRLTQAAATPIRRTL